MRKQLTLSGSCSPCWRELTVFAVVFYAVVVGGVAEAKLPDLPRLSRRQLLKHHNRLRKLSKALRPELPRSFHELTAGDVPIINTRYDGNVTFDRRKDQEVDGNGREKLFYQYPVGVNQPATPIRFKFNTDPLKRFLGQSNRTDEIISYIIETVLPEVEQAWDAYVGVTILPGAINLFQGHCFGFFQNDLESQTYYPDADLVMVVGGYDVLTSGTGKVYDVCSDNTLVVGSYCVVEEYGRPIIGFLNFCLNETIANKARRMQSDEALDLELLDPWRTNPPIADQDEALTDRDLITAAIHQTGHVMGMQFDLFKVFRNTTDGLNYTPQPVPKANVRCTDGSIRFEKFPAANTIQVNETSNTSVTFEFALPFTQTVARNHFNCQTLGGALLEADPNAVACVGSHFNGRVFFGELMQHLAYENYDQISPMTLSVMYDSFFYYPFYNDHIMAYGAGAGCEFANGADCIVDDEIPSYGKGFYCTNPIVVEPNGTISLDQNDILCDPLHQKWALCDLYDLSQVPTGFISNTTSARRWFSDRNLISTTAEVDYCPMPIVMLSVNCNDDSTSLGHHYQGEVYGETSRCINAALNTKRSVPACFNVTCDAKNFRVLVNGITCKYDGEIHSIQTMDKQNATFECPRFATICPELASCPSDCGGAGVCDYSQKPPKCICNNNSTKDANCQNPLANTHAPSPAPRPTKPKAPVAPPTGPKSAAFSSSLYLSTTLSSLMAAIVAVTW